MATRSLCVRSVGDEQAPETRLFSGICQNEQKLECEECCVKRGKKYIWSWTLYTKKKQNKKKTEGLDAQLLTQREVRRFSERREKGAACRFSRMCVGISLLPDAEFNSTCKLELINKVVNSKNCFLSVTC
jgi:hypothetical protein